MSRGPRSDYPCGHIKIRITFRLMSEVEGTRKACGKSERFQGQSQTSGKFDTDAINLTLFRRFFKMANFQKYCCHSDIRSKYIN